MITSRGQRDRHKARSVTIGRPRLRGAIVLAAVLAAMILASLTAVAQAQPPTGNDAVELFRRGERASLEQPTSDSVKRAAQAQERYYSTWGFGDTPAPAPAEPAGRPGWLVPTIGVLAGSLALLGVLAAMLLRRARGRVRVHQAA